MDTGYRMCVGKIREVGGIGGGKEKERKNEMKVGAGCTS